MEKYTAEQITAIIGFVDDFVTWVNAQIDKEITNTKDLSFVATPESRAKIESTTSAYSQCVHHLVGVTKQIFTENFGELPK